MSVSRQTWGLSMSGAVTTEPEVFSVPCGLDQEEFEKVWAFPSGDGCYAGPNSDSTGGAKLAVAFTCQGAASNYVRANPEYALDQTTLPAMLEDLRTVKYCKSGAPYVGILFPEDGTVIPL